MGLAPSKMLHFKKYDRQNIRNNSFEYWSKFEVNTCLGQGFTTQSSSICRSGNKMRQLWEKQKLTKSEAPRNVGTTRVVKPVETDRETVWPITVARRMRSTTRPIRRLGCTHPRC